MNESLERKLNAEPERRPQRRATLVAVAVSIGFAGLNAVDDFQVRRAADFENIGADARAPARRTPTRPTAPPARDAHISRSSAAGSRAARRARPCLICAVRGGTDRGDDGSAARGPRVAKRGLPSTPLMSPILKPSTRTIIATQSRVEPSADRFVGYPKHIGGDPNVAASFACTLP